MGLRAASASSGSAGSYFASRAFAMYIPAAAPHIAIGAQRVMHMKRLWLGKVGNMKRGGWGRGPAGLNTADIFLESLISRIVAPLRYCAALLAQNNS